VCTAAFCRDAEKLTSLLPANPVNQLSRDDDDSCAVGRSPVVSDVMEPPFTIAAVCELARPSLWLPLALFVEFCLLTISASTNSRLGIKTTINNALKYREEKLVNHPRYLYCLVVRSVRECVT